MTNALALALPGQTQVGATTRQTVLIGPVSGGLPSLLPATSASLSITSQGVAVASPLVLNVANGFGASGAVDYRSMLTSNLTWSGLTASTTAYLYINLVTGATGSSVLTPIYQFGGTLSTVNGQFTFDYQSMLGWMGNGTTVVSTPIVFVGEVVTGTSGVTSSITYAYQGYYDSGWTATLPGTSTSRSHNLGLQPLIKRFIAENTTSDIGYAVGDQISSDAGLMSGNTSYAIALVFPSTRNSVNVIISTTSAFFCSNKTSSASSALTLASWKYRFVIQRGW